MKIQQSAKMLRKRKSLLVMPLLVLPFITMAFWALGGGKGKPNSSFETEKQKGFNTKLPDAKFNPNEKQDKFSIYEIAERETKKLERTNNGNTLEFPQSSKRSSWHDSNTEIIEEKLALINAEIQNKPEPEKIKSGRDKLIKYHQSAGMSGDIERLEALMENFEESSGAEDPEMKQLNAVLEKILDIQHPERVKQKLENNLAHRENTALISPAKNDELEISSFLPNEDVDAYDWYRANAIQAVIHEDQEIVTGSVIKLRLLDSISVKGNLIPKNEFLYGVASVSGERLKIHIPTLRYRNSILTVSLSAFDLDGLEGLYIPGAITRDASKSGADDAIQSMQLMTLDPSFSAQAASAGIQAAKGLFHKKVRQVRVKVKAGYQMLLRNENLRNQ